MDRAAFGPIGPGDVRSKDSRPSTWRLFFVRSPDNKAKRYGPVRGLLTTDKPGHLVRMDSSRPARPPLLKMLMDSRQHPFLPYATLSWEMSAFRL